LHYGRHTLGAAAVMLIDWDADTACSAALDAMPIPDRKADLLLDQARRATRPRRSATSWPRCHRPPPTEAALFGLHSVR
jgi:hypothetical protein